MAFEGKNAAEFLKLLSTATLVEQTSKHGHYDWYPADKNAANNLNIQTRVTPLGTIEPSAAIREALDVAEKRLSKYGYLIEAAELLEGNQE